MTQVFPSAVHYVGYVVLTFPFEGQLVAALKADIPPYARAYDPDTKAWTIRAPFEARGVALLRRYFPHAAAWESTERARHSAPPPPPPKAPVVGPHAALFLLPSAPPEVVDAAYKALEKLHHPDRLPEPEKATGNAILAKINVAYQVITSGRKAS